ncbi:unnamed protein product, partial [Mesorhabditis spiculigera]
MLNISRQECLCDDLVNIWATGLVQNKIYKIHASFKHRTGTHFAYGLFKADARGTVDLSRDRPLIGTYREIDSMGLFHSMGPAEDVRPGSTVWATPPEPFVYTIKLLGDKEALLDELKHTRHWKHPLVRSIDVENEDLTGTVYLPPGPGPFPTVIDFAGTGGGIRQHRGALLASRGFATLALPFFGYKNLPADLEDVDVNYFLKAIDWLARQPFCGKIGMQGNSFGGVVCLAVADRTDKISAYCIINSLHVMDPNARIRADGEFMPCAELPMDLEYHFEDEALIYRTTTEKLHETPESEFRFRGCAPGTMFRFVAAIDDLTTPAVKSARILEERVKKLGFYAEVDEVRGGHLIEATSLPHMHYIYSGFINGFQKYGCEDPYTHCKSQQGVWERSKKFFAHSLGQPTPLPPLHQESSRL